MRQTSNVFEGTGLKVIPWSISSSSWNILPFIVQTRKVVLKSNSYYYLASHFQPFSTLRARWNIKGASAGLFNRVREIRLSSPSQDSISPPHQHLGRCPFYSKFVPWSCNSTDRKDDDIETTSKSTCPLILLLRRLRSHNRKKEQWSGPLTFPSSLASLTVDRVLRGERVRRLFVIYSRERHWTDTVWIAYPLVKHAGKCSKLVRTVNRTTAMRGGSEYREK